MRSIDRAALRERAVARGIRVARTSTPSEALGLIARLRNGDPLDPVLVRILRDLLENRESTDLPDDLIDGVDWIGASDKDRGSGLRDVLRQYDRIARSREPIREPKGARFARFEVRPERRAS